MTDAIASIGLLIVAALVFGELMKALDDALGWLKARRSSQRQQDGKEVHRASASERAETDRRYVDLIYKLEGDLRRDWQTLRELTGPPRET